MFTPNAPVNLTADILSQQQVKKHNPHLSSPANIFGYVNSYPITGHINAILKHQKQNNCSHTVLIHSMSL